MRVLRAVLKHVPSCNMAQISIACRYEKCAILKHVSDWHCANFVISKPGSKPHVTCKVLKHKNCARRPKVRPSYCILFVCLFFRKECWAISNSMS